MHQAQAQEPSAVRARTDYDSPSPLNYLVIYAVDVNSSSLTRIAWLLLSSFMDFVTNSSAADSKDSSPDGRQCHVLKTL